MADMSDRMGAYLDQREAIAERMLGWTCPCGAHGKGAVIPLAHQCPHALEAARQKSHGPAGSAVGSLAGLSSVALGQQASVRRFTRDEVLTVLKAQSVLGEDSSAVTEFMRILVRVFERME